MTYMRSWKSHRLTSHTWLDLNPQIGRPLSRILVPLVYFLSPAIRGKRNLIGINFGLGELTIYFHLMIICIDLKIVNNKYI
jgi:hypothetical protein